MNTILRHAAMAVLGLLGAAQAQAGAHVTFVEPEKYSDLPWSSVDRANVLQELRHHFDQLAAKLPAGQELNVDVTDIDLAGETRMNRMRGQDIRILNGRADWPRMALRYNITQDGKVIKSGEDHISDMGYMQHSVHRGNDDALRYEKDMLDQWFRDRVAVR
jgi:hypothetical protein